MTDLSTSSQRAVATIRERLTPLLLNVQEEREIAEALAPLLVEVEQNKRDVNKYAYERDLARRERDQAEARAEALQRDRDAAQDGWNDAANQRDLHKQRASALAAELAALRAEVAMLLKGFDRRVYVRNVEGDDAPDWAIRLLPFIASMGRLKALMSEPLPPPPGSAP